MVKVKLVLLNDFEYIGEIVKKTEGLIKIRLDDNSTMVFHSGYIKEISEVK